MFHQHTQPVTFKDAVSTPKLKKDGTPKRESPSKKWTDPSLLFARVFSKLEIGSTFPLLGETIEVMNLNRMLLWVWDRIVGNFLWWIILLILGSFGAAVKSRWPQLKVFFTTFPFKHSTQSVDINNSVSMPFYILSILLLGCAVILMALWNQHIQRDTKRLHVQMVRFVLPRSLSEDQMVSVGKVLSQSEPQIVDSCSKRGSGS